MKSEEYVKEVLLDSAKFLLKETKWYQFKSRLWLKGYIKACEVILGTVKW